MWCGLFSCGELGSQRKRSMRDGVLNTGFLEAEWLLNEWTGFGERKKIEYNFPRREMVWTKDCGKEIFFFCVCRTRALASRSGTKGGHWAEKRNNLLLVLLLAHWSLFDFSSISAAYLLFLSWLLNSISERR